MRKWFVQHCAERERVLEKCFVEHNDDDDFERRVDANDVESQLYNKLVNEFSANRAVFVVQLVVDEAANHVVVFVVVFVYVINIVDIINVVDIADIIDNVCVCWFEFLI
jgi:hypothetical protein